jgi:hypothetical protein
MGRSIPPAAASVLGLGYKFIITPKQTLKHDDIDETTKGFICNLELKVHYA